CVRRKQGPRPLPPPPRNPIYLPPPALHELIATDWDRGDERFAPTSFQISNMRSGTGAANVIPGQLEAVFNFRHAPVSTVAMLRARVEHMLARHGLEYAIEGAGAAQPYMTEAGPLRAAVCDAIAASAGSAPEQSTAGGTSDGRFFAATGAEVIELGPVNASIHHVN